MSSTAERYLKPEVIEQVARLDLKARFIVEGFLAGLHRSPYHGFSVEFSEHRKYVRGDSPRNIDWRLFGRTDRFYVKKYEAQTNLECHLVLDVSASMDYTFEQKLTKLDYSICLAAALGYMLLRQNDPVGMILAGEGIRAHLPPRARQRHLADMLALLSRIEPGGGSHLAEALHRTAGLLKRRGLVILFTDLHEEGEGAGDAGVLDGLHHLRFKGHDVILFHVLDAAEIDFPFSGPIDFEDAETLGTLRVDATGIAPWYRERIVAFRRHWSDECSKAQIDYLPLSTADRFDRALTSFLVRRQSKF